MENLIRPVIVAQLRGAGLSTEQIVYYRDTTKVITRVHGSVFSIVRNSDKIRIAIRPAFAGVGDYLVICFVDEISPHENSLHDCLEELVGND